MPNRFGAGCMCCQCVYEASDGSTYTDNFSSISGWTVNHANLSLTSTGGRGLLSEVSPGVPNIAYAGRTPGSTSGNVRVIIETDIYDPGDESATAGIFWSLEDLGGFPPTENYYWAFFARWAVGNWGVRDRGTFYTIAAGADVPSNGDKITLDLRYASTPNKTYFCCYVNETVRWFSQVSGNQIDAGDTIDYGILASRAKTTWPVTTGSFDDFTIQVD